MENSVFMTLTLIYFLALLSPGQDFFLIFKNALAFGYRKAWWSVGGIALGNAFYLIIALIGHEALSRYHRLMQGIEVLSILFLAYVGLALFFAPKPNVEKNRHVTIFDPRKLFLQGLLSALMNPKNILFYSSLLFTIITPQLHIGIKLFYALWMILMLVVWDMGIAWLFGNPKALRLAPYLGGVQKGVGVLLLGFSAHLAYAFVLRF